MLSPGQASDSRFVQPALESVRVRTPGPGRPRTRPSHLGGDKGYSYPNVRLYLKRRGIQPVIPTRKDQAPLALFDHARYRDRSSIEQCVGWLKENRRLATRYEKLSKSFLAMTHLAMISRCFRYLEDPSDRA